MQIKNLISDPYIHLDPVTTMKRNYGGTLTSEIPSIGASSPSLVIIVTSILVPLCVLALCTVVGFAGICILLNLYLIRKQRKECSTANEVNQTCYEVIDPIYETVPSTESKSITQDNFGITMMSNEAYVSSEKVISIAINVTIHNCNGLWRSYHKTPASSGCSW